MLTVQIDDASTRALLQKLAQRMVNLKPALQTAGNILRSTALDSFKNQASPDGKPWAPLSLQTRLARARRVTGGKLYTRNGKRTTAKGYQAMTTAQALLDRGNLRNSIGNTARGGVFSVDATSVTVGTRLPYAAIHQNGGKAGRGGKVRIPARPFIGLNANAKRQIINTINAYLGTVQR